MPDEPLYLLSWRDPKIRRSYFFGSDGVSCGILVVTNDSVTFASRDGIEFTLPRDTMKIKRRRFTQSFILESEGKKHQIYFSPPTPQCPPAPSQYEADCISTVYLHQTRTITVATNKTGTFLSLVGALLGGLGGMDTGGDIGTLPALWKARRSRKELSSRLRQS